MRRVWPIRAVQPLEEKETTDHFYHLRLRLSAHANLLNRCAYCILKLGACFYHRLLIQT
jgi:hypothetical protein